jgi:transposase-like protein
MYEKIDKIYLIPIKHISCPACGRKYGHHKTLVDTISQECSSCVKNFNYKDINLITATEYIETYLNIKPL